MKTMRGLYYPNRRTWLSAALAVVALPARHVRASTMDARAGLAGSALLPWVRESLAVIGRPRWLLLGEQHDADAHQALQELHVPHDIRTADDLLREMQRARTHRVFAASSPSRLSGLPA